MSSPVEKVAGLTFVTGASVSVSGGVWLKWLAENHQAIASLGIIGGFALGVLGLCVNVYYQRKRTRQHGGWID